MGRAPCCSKVGLHKGAWSSQEDALLTNYIQANGEGKWRSLPLKAGLLRCGKSCRLRWKNYLRPGVKRGNITAEEEELIIRLRSVVGNRWSFIAGKLPGRTDNEIKNHWNSHLLKRLKKEAGLITEPPPTKSRKKYHPKRSKKHPRNVLNPSTSTTDDNNNQEEADHKEEAINIVHDNRREVSEVSWSSLDQLDEQISLNEGLVDDHPLIVIDDEFWDLSSQGGEEELVLNDNSPLEQFYHEYLQLL